NREGVELGRGGRRAECPLQERLAQGFAEGRRRRNGRRLPGTRRIATRERRPRHAAGRTAGVCGLLRRWQMRTIRGGPAMGLVLFALASAPVTSQRRDASPKSSPDMKGPAPRLPNGKPSMTGVWDNTRRADVTNKAIPGFVNELPYTAWGRAKWEGYETFM